MVVEGAVQARGAAWHGRCTMRMQHGIVQEVATMRPIMQFLSSRLSGPGLRMWAQRSLGPTPLPAMVPRSTPEVGATRAGFMAFAAVLLLLLIVAVAVKVYDRTRRRKEEKDRITIASARLGRAP
jgi:hypothetical protein